MKRRLFLAMLLPAGQVEDLFDLGRRLAEENLDPSLLEALKAGDVPQVERLLHQAAIKLQGNYVLDLASMANAVKLALPLLEQHPETRVYASWLRSRADYFEMAETFRAAQPRPSPSLPQRTPGAPINPTPEQERKAWTRRVEKRPQPDAATRWVPRLKPVFREVGAPPELVWLAEVESSFDPAARSPEGAVGLFQLMPETATDLGLKLAPRDERLVPEKNGRAAARYLGKLRQQFGDWRLALSAYNAGPGRVSQLMKRRRATSFDAIAPDLPAETQLYVPKFEALLRRREGLALTSMKAAPGR